MKWWVMILLWSNFMLKHVFWLSYSSILFVGPPPLKNKGIKPPSFALFNNPKFISIAETVGISLSHSEEVDNYALDHELSSSNTIGVPVAPPQTYLSVLQHSTRSEENYSPSSPVVNSNVAVVDNISSRTPVIVAQTTSEDKIQEIDESMWTRVGKHYRSKHSRKKIH